MGPDFLAQELGWFSSRGATRRTRGRRELCAQMDFEDEWDEDLDDKVDDITGDYDEADDFPEIEDEELLENVEFSDTADDEY